jgi:hypothetical protein
MKKYKFLLFSILIGHIIYFAESFLEKGEASTSRKLKYVKKGLERNNENETSGKFLLSDIVSEVKIFPKFYSIAKKSKIKDTEIDEIIMASFYFLKN